MLGSSNSFEIIRNAMEDINGVSVNMDILADKIYSQLHANGIASLKREPNRCRD